MNLQQFEQRNIDVEWMEYCNFMRSSAHRRVDTKTLAQDLRQLLQLIKCDTDGNFFNDYYVINRASPWQIISLPLATN